MVARAKTALPGLGRVKAKYRVGKRLLPLARKATAPHAGRCAPTLLAVGLCAGTATSTFTAANH